MEYGAIINFIYKDVVKELNLQVEGTLEYLVEQVCEQLAESNAEKIPYMGKRVNNL